MESSATTGRALVLLLSVLLASTATCAQARARLQRRELFFFPSFGGEYFECWRSFFEGKTSCGMDLFVSHFEHRMQLSSKCCESIREASRHCFHNAFDHFPFNPFSPSALRDFCPSTDGGQQEPTLPPPSTPSLTEPLAPGSFDVSFPSAAWPPTESEAFPPLDFVTLPPGPGGDEEEEASPTLGDYSDYSHE